MGTNQNPFPFLKEKILFSLPVFCIKGMNSIKYKKLKAKRAKINRNIYNRREMPCNCKKIVLI